MNFKRTFMSLIAAIVLVSSFVICGGAVYSAGAGYSDVPGDSFYTAALERLASLNIMKGMQDGSFSPNEPVTKEQFAVIMVNAAGLKEKAVASRGTSFFSDIEDGIWSAGYINTAVSAGLIVGNADGTFRPYDNINLAQATTIMVKALGYTDSDVSGVWPSNYIEKARTLDLLDDMNFVYDSELPRWAVALMADRLLGTEMKKKTVTEAAKTFAESAGLGYVKEYIITSTGNMDASLASYKIRTEQGDLTTNGVNLDKYLGYKVKLLFNTDNEVCAVISTTFQAKGYTVSSIVGNSINYSEGAYESSLNIPDNLTMYYQGTKRTFGDFRTSIVQGSVIALAYNDTNAGKFEYGVLVDPNIGVPVVARKNVTNSDSMIGTIDITDKANITVIKNGSAAALTDIKEYDVVYVYKNPYSSKTVLDVYNEKVTGRYDEALPGKASVNKIKVDGKTMEIETVYAARRLDNSPGAFNIGDRITVLKGKDEKVVDVVVPYSSDYSNYAIVLNTMSDISKEEETFGRMIYKAKFIKSDGTVTDYIKVSYNCSGLKGLPVRYEMIDDVAEVQTIIENLPENEEGDIDVDSEILLDKNNRKIGKSWITTNAVFMDVINRNVNTTAKDADVLVLKWEDLPSGKMAADKVLYAGTTGPFKDVQMLIFDNLTNHAGQYGILMTESDSKIRNYKIMVNGKAVTYTFGTYINSNMGDVVYLEMKDGTVNSMKSIAPEVVSREVGAIDSQRIMVNGEIYYLAADVTVYRKVSDTVILPLSIYDIATDGSTAVWLYLDKDPDMGGKVRVIVVN